MYSDFSHFFIAVELDLKLIERLTLLQEDLGKIIQARHGHIRWTSPPNMHLTLKFLGAVDATRITELKRQLDHAAASVEPFSITSEGIGAFPQPEIPRIIYASVSQGHEPLLRLRDTIEDKLAFYHYDRDHREFKPHVTLGRVKTPEKAVNLQDAVQAIKDLNFGQSRIDEIVLYGSMLQEKGVKYWVVSRHSLGGRADEGSR